MYLLRFRLVNVVSVDVNLPETRFSRTTVFPEIDPGFENCPESLIWICMLLLPSPLRQNEAFSRPEMGFVRDEKENEESLMTSRTCCKTTDFYLNFIFDVPCWSKQRPLASILLHPFFIFWPFIVNQKSKCCLNQGSQTRGPPATCGPPDAFGISNIWKIDYIENFDQI